MFTIEFYAKCGTKYKWFSNLAPVPIEVNYLKYLTVEHYFQSQKYDQTTMAGKENLKSILNAVSPIDAKRLGKALGPIRPDWMKVRDKVMLQALRFKFVQHAYLAELLLETGDALLVEATADPYWGKGKDGRGQNKMGQLLTQVRGELNPPF